MTPESPSPVVSDLLNRDDHDQPSVFLAKNMMREARRQRGLPSGCVPTVCVLDPDGDIARYCASQHGATLATTWACYHTELWEVTAGDWSIGIVPHAVGAPFAVLVAEELFASGCELLVSVTSAGKIDPAASMPEVVLVDRALRGEGTSHAYLASAASVGADPALINSVARSLQAMGLSFARGMSWTTDAPFRETRVALDAAAQAGATIVEMEAAALYAFGIACQQPVVCFAQVTNSMAVDHGDFEKGPSNGAELALTLVQAAADGWKQSLA